MTDEEYEKYMEIIQLFLPTLIQNVPTDSNQEDSKQLLDSLKVYVEYTLLDLEATRRELEYLKSE